MRNINYQSASRYIMLEFQSTSSFLMILLLREMILKIIVQLFVLSLMILSHTNKYYKVYVKNSYSP